MTHVTVVQVHEPHLGQVRKDGSLGSFQVTQEDRRMICQEGSFAPKECLAEILYVNVMELRQQTVPEEGTPGDPHSSEDALKLLPELKSRKRRLSRKSSIMNQNVGVTGGVFMKSDPESEIGVLEDSDNESESSESSLSGSDSGLSSTIEVGMSPTPKHSTTITIGDEVSSHPKAPGEDTLWLQGTVGEEAHCTQRVVSEKTNYIQKPVNGGTIWCQKPVDEETQFFHRAGSEKTICNPEAVGGGAIWSQKTVDDKTVRCQKPAVEETLRHQEVIGEERFRCQKPAVEETLWHQEAIGEERLWHQEVIGEETLRCQKPAVEETLWHQEVIGEETLRCQKPVVEETLWHREVIGNETLWRQEAIGEERLRHQKAIVNETSSRQKGIFLHVSPKPSSSSCSDNEDHPTTNPHPHDEIISIEYSNFELSEDLSEAAVTLEWRVIPPSHPVMQQHPPLLELEGEERGSTPTSFSSAYTVTENESTSEESESSRNHNWSGPESDEEPHGLAGTEEKQSSVSVEVRATRKPGTYEHNEPQTNDSKIADSNISLKDEAVERRIFPTISDSLVKEAVLSAVPSVLRRLRHPSEGSTSSSSSGEESIVYSYIPCRDQREKEDEELWVANEAADPRGAQDCDSPTPPLLPPPVGWEGAPGSPTRAVTSKSQQSIPGTVWSEQSSGVDVRVCEFPRVGPIMCTVAPTIAGDPRVGVPAPPRKHYSTRQRTSPETQVIKFKVVEEEAKCKDKWRELTDSAIEGDKANLPTSLMTRKPTKRFSFLVRSNSVKQEDIKEDEAVTCTATGPPAGHEAVPAKQATAPQSLPKKAVTPSDQAILDKLASLNIETPAEVKLRIKRRVSLHDPPCTRCGEPVYPQERTEPTLRLVFHTSCFKCHHCGLRLTLKTFFRSPLDSRDTRLFCRSHVPTLDPGKLDAGRSDSSASSGKSSPDSEERENQNDVFRGRSISPSTCIQERLEIVKCDTIGLRYF